MSLLATAVLIAFLLVSAVLFLRSRRPESSRPSVIMLKLMDAADELEKRAPSPEKAPLAARTKSEVSRSGMDRPRKNSPLAPVT